jgi:protein SCO1/2
VTRASRTSVPTEHDVESLVNAIRLEPSRRDELVDLLREDSAIYVGRGGSTATRIRGWIMATFETVGLPAAALPYVLEDLESELDPYAVAAAAKATRGLKKPAPFVASSLVAALSRMRGRDDTVTFESLWPSWPSRFPTTAILEILASIRWLGHEAVGQRGRLETLRTEHADTWSTAVRRALETTIEALPSRCCASREAPTTDVTGGTDVTDGEDADISAVLLEDQDGTQLTFDAFFNGRTVIVAFFYTRCANPNKCSLTITKLAELQSLLGAEGLADSVNIAAITYDPGYDLPARMRSYGESRGLRFTESARMFRARSGHELLQQHFRLRVGYVGSIVNRHAIELFLVDAEGHSARTWARLQWDVEDVLREATGIASGNKPLRNPTALRYRSSEANTARVAPP